MIKLIPIRSLSKKKGPEAGDLLVLFGELVPGGYATGLVEEAKSLGMRVIYSTLGKQDGMGLRALNEAELKEAFREQPSINVPLEAGFDLCANAKGDTLVEHLKKNLDLKNWQAYNHGDHSIGDLLKEWMELYHEDFKSRVSQFLKALEAYILPGQKVVFAHLMAGGIPRSKVVLPLINRIFKGSGERFVSSEEFWNSGLGKVFELNFNEVSAESFKFLIELSGPLREKIESNGGRVSYLAYGYHGTEILVQNKYLWQTYTPYLQGFAKKRLEGIAETYKSRGVNCVVFNCPEILTHSSSIFIGVENSLYPLFIALKKEDQKSPYVQKIISRCEAKLKDDFQLEILTKKLDQYLAHPNIRKHCDFLQWPTHNSPEQMELMIQTAKELRREMHKSENDLITSILSEAVFKATGKIMLNEVIRPENAVVWIGHDIIVQILNQIEEP